MEHPSSLQSQLSAAIDYHRKRDFTAAEAIYSRLIDASFPTAEPWLHLADIRRHQFRAQEALELINAALKIEPGNAMALVTKGLIHEQLDKGGLQQAIACYEAAISADPQCADAHFVLASAHERQGRVKHAIEHYRKAVDLAPAHTLALFNLGYLHTLINEFEPAAEFYRRASMDASHVNAISQHWHMRMKMCDWSEYDLMMQQLTAATEITTQHGPEVHHFNQVLSPFSLINLFDDPEIFQRTASRYINTVVRGYDSEPIAAKHAALSDAHGDGAAVARPTVALVSGDFRAHPTALLIVELLECLRSQPVELHLVSFGPDDGSALRQRIVDSGHQFHDLFAATDNQIAHYIAGLNCDIAVDLNGLTTAARPAVFAQKPAPIQVNYLAYPGTNGAGYFDYLLADSVVIPPSEQQFYSESVVSLPYSYQCNDRQRQVATPPSREDCGLPEGAFVFCCFNSLYKLTPDIFSIWCDALQRKPDSVLWLLDDNRWATQNLIVEAKARGIDESRLIFAPRLPIEQHLARLQLADLFLDTWPCSAHTTAGDALWVGLPILTCTGRSFQSRVAASLLSGLGFTELVTGSLQDYKHRLHELASDSGELTAIRARLQASVRNSPVFDTYRFARQLCIAFNYMVERSRQGIDAAPFRLSETDRIECEDAQSVTESTDDHGEKLMDSQKLKINIALVAPEASRLEQELADVCDAIEHSLLLMEFAVSRTVNDFNDHALNLVIGAERLEADDWQYIPASSILYLVDDYVVRKLPDHEHLLELLNRFELWVAENPVIDALAAAGVVSLIQNVPLGYMPQLTRIEKALNPGTDVLFYGELSPRRKKILDKLDAAGLSVRILTDSYGQERDQYIGDSRIVLNLRKQDDSSLESVKLNYLMANGVPVVSEKAVVYPDPAIRDALCEASYDELVATCIELVKDEQRRAELSERAMQYSRSRFHVVGLHRALEAIGGRPASETARATDTVLNIFDIGEQDPDCLNLCVQAGSPADIHADLSDKNILEQSFKTTRFGDVLLTSNQFDEIRVNDVFASTSDMVQAMSNCLSLLKDGGRLTIDVPYDLSANAWSKPTYVRAFNEKSWNIYTENYSALGWRQACFETTAMDVTFSALGEELMLNEHPVEAVIAQPRAVESLQVVLTKRVLLHDAAMSEQSTSAQAA